jgi:hypothetical protein
MALYDLRLHARACAVAAMLLAGLVGTAAGSREPDIQFLSVKAVDYHDQLEMPVPALAGLEPLVGREAAERTAVIAGVPGRPMERPHRALLRVEFRSTKDLWGIARRKGVVFLHSSFCQPNEFAALGDPTVYYRGRAIYWTNLADSASTGSEEVYYFYLSVSRRKSLKDIPPETGFDLRENPEDICFYVTGSGFFGYKSAIATVPKGAISEALKESHPPTSNPPG